jgi:predicted lipoprotein with Yx(FWY)xxD motif
MRSWIHSDRLSALMIVAVTACAAVLLVGAALATTTYTLQVAKSARVKNAVGATSTENIVVNSRSRAVYYLTGDSKSHPKCTKTNHCFGFWPPVTVTSASKLTKGPSVKGTVSVWHRDGFFQVVLAGHPLYTYTSDSQRQMASGQGAHGFGGTWYVIKAGSGGSSGGSGGGSSSSSNSSSSSSSSSGWG